LLSITKIIWKDKILQIFTKIPIFEWPVFFILLFGGLKARKTNTVPLALLLLIPALLFVWSLYAFFGKYDSNLLLSILWFLCLSAGFFIGFLHVQKLKLQFDKQKKRVEMPGSWTPLVLSISIFSAKFSLGMISAMAPHLNGSILLLCLEFFATIILGIFVGRGIGCLFKYRSAKATGEMKI
jgi:hypothetical protein